MIDSKLRTLCLAVAACGVLAIGPAAASPADDHEGTSFTVAAKPTSNNEGYCNAYAKRAVAAQKKNLREGCGFGGPRWHTNYDRHYQWCLRVRRANAESESKARQKQLQQCKKG